jgi:hypothetical protein
MFCSNCGTKIEEGATFCQSCGKATSENKVVENEKKTEVKNYSPVFWKYFWIGVLLNVFSRGVESAGGEGLWIIFFILAGIYIYKFSATINEAMLSIGKKNWWPLGLLSIIPFGFWIAFLVVRAKLKPHGGWVSKHKSFKMSKGI